MLRKLPIEFTNKKASPWGGIHLFRSVMIISSEKLKQYS